MKRRLQWKKKIWHGVVCECLNLECPTPDLKEWTEYGRLPETADPGSQR